MADTIGSPLTRWVRLPPKHQRLPMAIVLLVAGLWLSFYVSYSRRAWFMMDDLFFLERYAGSPHLARAFAHDSNLRPLTRNLYWFVGQKVLGRSAQAFYLANLCNLIATSVVAGWLFARRHGRVAGFGAGLIYLACPPVALTFVWISGSQHLIPHLLVMAFLAVLFGRPDDAGAALSWWRAGGLIALLLVGALANTLVLLVAVAVPIDMISRRVKWREHLPEATAGVVGAVTLLVILVFTPGARGGIYSSQYSLHRFLTNGEFYFGTRVVLLIWAATMIAGTASGILRGRALEAALFGLSLAFYFPFAFLRFQMYHYYAALPMVCALLALWSGAFRLIETSRGSLVPVVALAAWAILVYSGGSLSSAMSIRQLAEPPSGLVARSLVTQLDAIVATEGWRDETLCFTAVDEPGRAMTDVYDYPAEWWQVGWGAAFRMFAAEPNTYRYVYADESLAGCQERLWLTADGKLLTALPG